MRWLKRLWRRITGADDAAADILRDVGDPRLAREFKNVQQGEEPPKGGGGTFGGGGASGGW